MRIMKKHKVKQGGEGETRRQCYHRIGEGRTFRIGFEILRALRVLPGPTAGLEISDPCLA